MKSFFILLILAVYSFSTVLAQADYPEYWNNLVYFKVKTTSDIVIPEFKGKDAEKVLQDFPVFIDLVASYNISEIIRPFKIKNVNVQNMYRITLNHDGATDEIIKKLSALEYIEYAEKCPVYKLMAVPNDTLLASQYYLTSINAFAAWDIATGSHDVKVAIVDDACRITHPDLAGNLWVNPGEIPGDTIDNDGNGYIDDISGYDVADSDNNPNAPLNPPYLWGQIAFTHGTHCSGLAAAVTGNTTGIASVSHNVSLIPVKTVNNGSYFPLAIGKPAEGVDFAVSAGADIVSMSFGGATSTAFTTLEQIIAAGHDLGITFVAAAGNDGAETVNYPAGFPYVISVGATTEGDTVASFSQFGDWIDVMSPGAAMFSTLAWSTPYNNMDGTSMACPLTAGVLALMKSHVPDATPDELELCLKSGCDIIDSINPTFIGKMGAGRVNVYNSLICLENLSIPEPQISNLKLFPNPADEQLQFEYSGTDDAFLMIYDISGRPVMEKTLTNNSGSIDISQITNGFYCVVISDKANVIRKNILIKH